MNKRRALLAIAFSVLLPTVGGSDPPPADDAPASSPRQFWSFRPLRVQPPPRFDAEVDRRWLRTRLDRFILARLHEQRLAPSESATRRTLIRRLAFDLVGLPPTPAEIEQFLADRSPDAWERLVERLLASPHYGERWGRTWLDLARYTDTTANWLKSTAQAWRYRDWVVEALNDDVPYDQFIRLQLAADHLDDRPPDDLRALGFLGLSPTYWKELRLSPELIKRVVAEEWEERIDTIGRTFLGLTIACARCHDHKFDPVTQEDYYALAGVLASTRLIDVPLLPLEQARIVQRADEQIKGLEAEVQRVRNLVPPPKDRDPRVKALEQQIARVRQETPGIDAPRAHAVEDAGVFVLPDGPDMTRLAYRVGQARDLRLQYRGSPTNLGETIRRRFLAVLSPGPPRPFRRGSGRRELAEALVDPARGGSLTARVIVNRVWRLHFGHGLVTTPSNFGFQGEAPSHPRLLDDLAARFIHAGWSLKWLHREIVLSATWRQSSDPDEHRTSIDPANRWLRRMNRRRLPVEAWRDAMLAVGDRLDHRLGGSPLRLSDQGNWRRTLYARIDRRDLDKMLRLYDFPDPTGHSPKREETTTPLQQLFMLNSPFITSQSAAVTRRVRASGDRVRAIGELYQLLFARPPSAEEMELADEFLAEGSWPQYVQVLLASNEFVFVD